MTQCQFIPFDRRAGFSLLELLIVIAIVGMLASFAISGFNNIGTSRGVTQAASDAASLLELARNEAITRQTYTWVAFQNVSNSGVLEVQMVAIGSADGTTNTSSTNLMSLSRIIRARACALTNYSSLKSETTSLLGSGVATPVNLSTNGIVYTVSTNMTFNKGSITFTPRGQALLTVSPSITNGFEPAIGLGFLPARGNGIDTNSKDDAGVVVDGSTGTARVLRL